MKSIAIQSRLCPLRVAILMDHPQRAAWIRCSPPYRNVTTSRCTSFTASRAHAGRGWKPVEHQLVAEVLPHVALPGPLMMWNPGIGSLIGDRGRYDIWLVNTCYTSASTQHAVARLRRQRTPWVYMNEPPRPWRGYKGWLQRVGLHPVIASADGYVGMGKEAARRYSVLHQELGRSKPTISVPYYVDIPPFLGLRPPAVQGIVRFLCVAQLVRRKGLDILLSACRALPREGWELCVYGSGPLRDELLRRADGLQAVRFAGTVPYERRTAAFEGQHVFVFPSRWDGFGMVIPEALAAGLPVVTTDQVMSAWDFVRDGVNGFICPADRADRLAERMRWFLDNPHRIGPMSQAARDALSAYRPELGAAEAGSVPAPDCGQSN